MSAERLPGGIRHADEFADSLHLPEASDWVWFVRHASKADGSRFLSLEENQRRGLSPEGVEEAVGLGRRMLRAPEIVLSSPIARARQTAEGIARGCPSPPRVVVDPDLFGGSFRDHDRWLELKRELGWETLVRRWLAGEVSSEIIEGPDTAVGAVLRAVRAHMTSAGARRVLVLTQGYVNTALFAHIHGVIDFTGGSLRGFVVDPSCVAAAELHPRGGEPEPR